jgi:hypothetical protein
MCPTCWLPNCVLPASSSCVGWKGLLLRTADCYLDTLTPELLQTHLQWQGKPRVESVGTMLLRNIYHYWMHLGEAHSI